MLQAVGAEGSAGGARYVRKNHICCHRTGLNSLPDGDEILFPAGTPLHMRKDILAAAAYMISVSAYMPSGP